MHQLDGAYQRVRRAGIHLANLNRRVNALRKAIYDSVAIDRKPQSFVSEDGKRREVVLGSAKFLIEPVQHTIKILIGEIIYNLRAALDYLIYELARLDSGQVIDGTQFPIENSINGFKRRRKSFLKGISDEHVTIVEGLQPYNGCDWTKLIAALSNPDKHRKLTIANSSVIYSIPQGSTKAILADKPVDIKNGLAIHV